MRHANPSMADLFKFRITVLSPKSLTADQTDNLYISINFVLNNELKIIYVGDFVIKFKATAMAAQTNSLTPGMTVQPTSGPLARNKPVTLEWTFANYIWGDETQYVSFSLLKINERSSDFCLVNCPHCKSTAAMWCGICLLVVITATTICRAMERRSYQLPGDTCDNSNNNRPKR